MVSTTESKETVSRKEFATYLRNLADQFESRGDARIRVGNRSVTVSPPESVKREIRVRDRTAVRPNDRQAVDLVVEWTRSE